MKQNKKAAPGAYSETDSPARKPPASDSNQLRARTTLKDARIKEAGLEGRRVGSVSASGKRAQARRDSKH